MKWVKFALLGAIGIVAISIVVLLLLGGGRGESQLTVSVDIAKPAPTVFTWVSHPDKLRSWVGWLVDVRDVTPGQPGVGARQVWVMEDRNNGNQRMDIQSEVVGYEPGRLLVTRVSAQDGFTGDVRYELEPMDGNRTRLTYHASYKFEHWLAKLLEPVISRSAQQKLEEDIARLKQQVEAS